MTTRTTALASAPPIFRASGPFDDRKTGKVVAYAAKVHKVAAMQSQHSSPAERERRTVPHALGEVIQRGQALIVNRLDLLGVELRQALDAGITRIFQLGIALLLFCSGFCCLTVAAIITIGNTFDFATASAIVGVTYLLAGGFFIASARHKQRVRMGAFAKDPTEAN